MMKPEKITVIQFDTEIKSVNEVRNVRELMHINFTGRGGTLINPVLEWANKNKPQLLLVFSDGEFRFYDTETKTNTLWLIHGNPDFSAPFGKTIHYVV
jgi:predicted metal-dependent peptidase